MKVMRERLRRAQRGAATLLAVILLITVIAFSLLVAALYASSSVNDALQQDDSIAALFLAESALEHASQVYAGSGTCDAAGVGVPVGTPAFGRGSFQIVSAAPAGALCTVQTRGLVGSARRTITAQLRYETPIALDATSTSTTNSWAHTVAPGGVDRLLVVGVSMNIRNNPFIQVTGVTYGGQNLVRELSERRGIDVRTEIWYLVDPPTGAANIVLTLSAAPNRLAAGAVSFTGVDQTTPIEASATAQGGNSTPSVAVTTLTNGAWLVDSLAVRRNVVAAPSAAQTALWNFASGNGGNGVQGAGSFRGPLTPAGPYTMSWTLNNNRSWALGAIAIRPAGSVKVVSWQES